MRVHFNNAPSKTVLNAFRESLADTIQLTGGKENPARFACDVLIEGRPSEDLIRQNPNLKAIVIPYAGLPESTREFCLQHPQLKVYNLHHNAVITAEMAVTLMLSAARFLVFYDSSFRKGDWRMRYTANPPSMMLNGKKVLLIGFGAIGKRVAEVCKALGMQVEAIKRQVGEEGELHDGVPCFSPARLHERLADTHVLQIVCPLTDATRGMIDAVALNTMPSGGVLVNVGRAQIVEEEALYQALASGQLAAAGLDVWYQYPQSVEARAHTLPAAFPFWEMAQVILSPHRGSHTQETETLRMQFLAELLNGLAAGNPKIRSVDVQAGY